MWDRERESRAVRAVKLGAFAAALGLLSAAGLFLRRPEISVLEKRKLAQRPSLSAAGLWDGSFFSGVDAWYADTYPIRETLFSANHALQSHYGLRDTQLVGGAAEAADVIPAVEAWAGTEESKPSSVSEPTPTPDGTVHALGELQGVVYITDRCAYSLYYFSQAGADAYVAAMNEVYGNVGDKVNMYVLLAPISTGVMLDEAVLDDMGASSVGDAIAYLYSRLDPGISTVDAFENLRAHNGEYIYFHTDHHWTQRGAYYAYEAFCREKGWTPHSLEDFRVESFGAGSYLGSFYAKSNQSPALASNPDTVWAYYPNGTNDMRLVTADGQACDWRIINDRMSYPDSEWYCLFSGADQPFACAHNPQIADGSAVLVVKDSYGNALIPWLVDHYEYVYWIDFRYTQNTVSQMVADYGVQDVIFESAIFNATGGRCNGLFTQIGR